MLLHEQFIVIFAKIHVIHSSLSAKVELCQQGSGSTHASLLQTCRATAHEIAAALAYLHSQDLLHGDLTGGNILLASSDTDERGFSAKVADFGLSRTLGSEPVDTGTYGTVTHMPPELLTTGTAFMLILVFCLFKLLLMTLPVVVAACAYSWHIQTGVP